MYSTYILIRHHISKSHTFSRENFCEREDRRARAPLTVDYVETNDNTKSDRNPQAICTNREASDRTSIVC